MLHSPLLITARTAFPEGATPCCGDRGFQESGLTRPRLCENSHIGAGARVRKLTLGGAAETAGLRVDDVIQKIDQRFLRRPEDLLWFREVVEYGEIGRHLTVTVARMENHRIVARTLRVPIGTRPEGSRGDELEDPPCEPDCAPEPGGRPKPDKTPTVEPQSGGKIGA